MIAKDVEHTSSFEVLGDGGLRVVLAWGLTRLVHAIPPERALAVASSIFAAHEKIRRQEGAKRESELEPDVVAEDQEGPSPHFVACPTCGAATANRCRRLTDSAALWFTVHRARVCSPPTTSRPL